MKYHKLNEAFDATISHDFEPSDELVHLAQKAALQIKVGGLGGNKADEEATEKMHKCKHDRLWHFSVGSPLNIIGCCDCSYWEFFHF